MVGFTRTNTVNGDALADPLLHLASHRLRLGVAGLVEVVVVDVQLSIGIRGPGGAESDADKVLAEDLREDGGTEGAVFVEDLIDNVLIITG